MRKVKKNKKIWKFSVISLFGILPVFLASCSAQTNFFDKTVYKDTGTFLDNNTSLKDYVFSSLKSDTGMKAYLSEITNQLIFKWLEKLSKTTNINFKNSFINQNKLIEDNYKDLVKKYQTQYKNDWALKFQQEVLDGSGGSEQSYKQSQWNSWATAQFETYLFNKSYLTYKKDDGTIVNPSNISNANVVDVYNALEKQNLIFGFPTVNDSSTLSNDVIDKTYADFMQFVWEQYVQIVNPYVVDMSLWKYGTPPQGLGSLYTNASSTVTTQNPDESTNNPSAPTDIATSSNLQSAKNNTVIKYKEDVANPDDSGNNEEGGDSGGTTTSAAAASYIYPYFGNDAIGSTSGTVSKFVSFINQANSATDSTIKLPTDSSSTTTASNTKIPFKSSYDINGYGLLYIPTSYTDDSSTFILAKNNSIYSDLYIEFAAASSYLFWRNSNVTTDVNFKNNSSTTSNNSGIPNIDTKIQKDLSNSISINNDATTGLDTISNEFISTSSIFSDGDQYQIKLDKSYVNKVINQNGDISKLRDKDLYVIDSFIPKNNNLSNYMLLRNSAGVHAITIDGYNYINGSTTATSTLSASEKKKRAGQIVLFRSLYNTLNAKDSSYSFDVNLQTELKTFYENNVSWLIYLYASTKTDNILFNLNDLNLTDNEKNAANAINNFLHEISFYKKVDEYNEALINGKNTYSANYGTSVYENGLAAPWIYSSFSDNDAKTYDSNKNISFQIAATVSSTLNPFSETNEQKNYDGSNFTSSIILDSNLQALANELQTLNSGFEGFKYSQFIYSNSSYVNAALLAYSNEGSNLPNLSKINYLKKYIGDFFNFDTLKFSALNVSYSSKTVDISKYLNYALSNFFFNSSFDNVQIKWLKLGDEESKKWDTKITTSTDNTDLNEILQNYKVKLWKSENAVLSSTAIENYLKLYTTVATTKFMVENNFDFFLNQMSSLISNGEDAYVAWQNSENKALQKTTDQNNSASALMSAKTINRNINNSYFSSYIGGYKVTNQDSNQTKAPLTITYQEELINSTWTNSSNPNIGIHSSYQDSTTVPAYYSISNNMSGFLGLQKNSSNSLNSIVSNRLFSSPTLDNKDLVGILYGYGSDLETVIKVIQNTQTVDGINNIANDLASKLKQNQLKEVAENKTITLKEKKNKLITAVTNLSSSLSSTKVFSQRAGILNEGYFTETNNNGLLSDSSQPLLQFASYVIQLSRYNLSSSNSLLDALSVNTTESNSDNEGAFDILSNLVIQQAIDSNLQDRIMNSILASVGKIKAYDVRLYVFLGVEWILDWKVTNPISSNSSSGSDSLGTETQPTPTV
ncbi:MAG: hypothetical protein K2I76_04100 [Malacoplasma sp.]|nr:hypothetical protein [Malacoplasma sp.]